MSPPLLPVRRRAKGEKPPATHAAGYSRVSTDEQDTASQRRAVELLAESRGDVGLRWFEDHGASGTTTEADRPQLRALLDAAHRGEVRRVYLYAMDRLTRRGPLHALTLLDQLHRAGCEVVSSREPFLSGDPAMRSILVSLVAWVGNMERLSLVARTKAGLAEARAKGKRLGRPPVDPAALDHGVALVRGGRTVAFAARTSGVSESRLRQALRAAGMEADRRFVAKRRFWRPAAR